MTEIKSIENVLNQSANNATKPIQANAKDEKVQEKSFNNVLNKCKVENSKPSREVNECKDSIKKVEVGNAKTNDVEELSEEVTDVNEEINKLLLLLQSLVDGKISVKDFMDKVKAEPNGEEILNLLISNMKNINAIADSNEKVINNINILSKNSPETELLSLFNSFIEKYDNGTKLNKFEDIEPYILKNFVSSDENSALKTELKNTIANLLKENSTDSLYPSKVKEESSIILTKIGAKEALNNILDKKVITPDTLEEKNISTNEGENAITSIKIEGSEISKDNGDSSKSNFSSDSDEKLLNDLISNDNKDNKYNKVNAFMSQLSRIKDNAGITVEDNLIVSKNNFTNDIIKTVKYMEINNMKDLTVKVAPKELGEMVIKLTMEAGVMKANITAVNKETANMLNASLEELNSKLNNTDIKIQNFTVDIYNGDTAFFKKESNHNQENSQKGKTSRVNEIDSIEEEDADFIEEQGNVNILA